MAISDEMISLAEKDDDDGTGKLIRQFSIYASAREPGSDLAQELMVEEAIKHEQDEMRATQAFRHLYEDSHGLRRFVPLAC